MDKHRDCEAMPTFDCGGWLHITLSENTTRSLIKMDHHNNHMPYWEIDIPEDVKAMIINGKDKRPSQVRELIFVTLPVRLTFLLVVESDFAAVPTAMLFLESNAPHVVTNCSEGI